ncbi:MAG: ATP-dependent DNA helicase [Saccharospirillum sp.]|nr:ATP-dependent DNA helicase [Saccharospirillum sp.]
MTTSDALPRFRLSVRALADFCQAEGDLVSTFRPGPSALEGRETHQLTQQRRGPGHQCEVALQLDWQSEDCQLRLSGRLDVASADGIEELKSCRLPPEEIPETVHQSNALQARFYAALWALQSPDQSTLRVRLTYVHSQTQQEWPRDEHWQRQDLIDLLVAALTEYDHWLTHRLHHQHQRNTALKALAFPFRDMRAVQRTMAENVYKAQVMGRNALIEAPTGTGKTLAALFPALKALAQGHTDGLYYLTMKTTGQKAVLDSLDLLNLPDQAITTITLGAKERLCLSPDTPCDGSVCPYAENYYGKRHRVRSRLYQGTIWHQQALTELAQQEQICPYYLSQDWALWADLVIGDLNYLYDTTALQPWLLKEVGAEVTVLIDECHNLVDRGRQMFSASFTGKRLETLKGQAPKRIQQALHPVSRALKGCLPEQDGLSDLAPEALVQALRTLLQQSASLLRDCPFWEPPESWQQLLFDAGRFVRLHELAEPQDFCWRYRVGKPAERVIDILCLNPARLLGEKHDLVRSVVAFSATATPWHYSKTLTGLEQAVQLALPSPFTSTQFEVTLVTDLSTRYRDQAQLAQALPPLIRAFRRNTPGNALVFFSSYQQLALCLPAFSSDPSVIAQRRDFTLLERLALIDRLATEDGLMVFAPLGGVLAEGIDLPGKSLTGVMVIGPGLPQLNPVNERIRNVMQQAGLDGFDFAYRFPGLHKVLQAAGRCVRTDTDIGQIWLVDDRFRGYFQAGWLPTHWQVREARQATLLEGEHL